MSIPDHYPKWKAEHGYTTDAVAKLIGVPALVMFQVEAGNMQLRSTDMDRLHSVMGIDLFDQLFGFTK